MRCFDRRIERPPRCRIIRPRSQPCVWVYWQLSRLVISYGFLPWNPLRQRPQFLWNGFGVKRRATGGFTVLVVWCRIHLFTFFLRRLFLARAAAAFYALAANC